MLSDENALLWLASVLKITPKRKHELIETFGSASELISAGASGVRKAGFTEDIISALFDIEPEKYAADVLGRLYKTQTDFISFNSDEYPQKLRQIYDCPLVLFKKGKLPDMSQRSVVSMVGSRRCTSYGATVTYDMAKELSDRGVVIVSGMADGIDSMSHKGALDAGGDTVAVLGCGVDICYPAGNRELMDRICEKGCVISELPPSVHPSKYTFPARNRIISGLCDVLAVMEADEKSGTLITVDHAIDQGRDVMALPGNIVSRFSRGTNRLIKEGAGIITSAEDICCCLGLEPKDKIKKISEKINISLAPEEKLVYDCIHSEPVTSDEITASLGLSVRDVQYALTMLELKGAVSAISGHRYIRRI